MLDAKRREKKIQCPDFMMGDLNVTEDPIDRASAHADDLTAIEALWNLRHSLNLQDSWRHSFPHECIFTYRAHCNGKQIKSHLDRIYTSSTASKHTFRWEVCQTATPMDHLMVLTKYAPTKALYIGKGRWTWQLPSLEDKKLMDEIVKRGIELQGELNQITTLNPAHEISNLQTLWKSFKDDIRQVAKKLQNVKS